jgi:hypothetical protein
MALRLNADSASERVFGVRPEGVGVPKEVWLGGIRMRCTESPILVVRWGDRNAGLKLRRWDWLMGDAVQGSRLFTER